MEPQASADESGLRDAERRLAAALEAGDPTAWVTHYTEDAVFDGGGDEAVVGRDALLDMARSMRPLRSVSIHPLRTEARDGLAAVWTRATWTSEGADGDPTTVEVRGLLVWRRGADGTWRVAMEHLG